ncbi:MAG: hypothetical protein QFX36_04000 [Archaeoglobales archaeon]|nr:hypothetical protein [Archaeoglobales archaeon]
MEALITAIFTAVMGQYLLLIKINSAITRLKAEFKACPNHRCIFKNGDCNDSD